MVRRDDFALDTSAVVEFIVANSPWRDVLKRLLSSALSGANKLYLSTVTLAEVFYVSKRIYEGAGVKEPEEASRKFLLFLKKHRGMTMVPPDFNIAAEAGKIKSTYRISLADSFVLATAKILGANALFRKAEEEMEPFLEAFRRNYGFITLNEISFT